MEPKKILIHVYQHEKKVVLFLTSLNVRCSFFKNPFKKARLVSAFLTVRPATQTCLFFHQTFFFPYLFFPSPFFYFLNMVMFLSSCLIMQTLFKMIFGNILPALKKLNFAYFRNLNTETNTLFSSQLFSKPEVLFVNKQKALS